MGVYMAESTSIEWCDATFNPWWGCQKVSPACDHCYAERDAARFSPGRVLWGVGAERRTFDEKHWQQPLKWAKRAFVACPACGWRGMHTKLAHDNGSHRCPTCGNDEWRPARQRVFCASMADWLDIDAPLDQFMRLLDTIRRTPELDWLLLSKRIGNWRKRLDEAVTAHVAALGCFGGVSSWAHDWLNGRAPANVWLGATVIDQAEADRDVLKLLQAHARVRFLSIEPMLGPIVLADLGADKFNRRGGIDPLRGERATYIGAAEDGRAMWAGSPFERVHWVICGGESGPHARPLHPDWARGLRDQCAAAGAPFLFKQWGEWAPAESVSDDDERQLAERWIRADGSEPPRGAGVDFFGGDEVLYRIGKKAAGRLLDGRTHNEFPLTKLQAAEKEAREPSLFPPPT